MAIAKARKKKKTGKKEAMDHLQSTKNNPVYSIILFLLCFFAIFKLYLLLNKKNLWPTKMTHEAKHLLWADSRPFYEYEYDGAHVGRVVYPYSVRHKRWSCQPYRVDSSFEATPLPFKTLRDYFFMA